MNRIVVVSIPGPATDKKPDISFYKVPVVNQGMSVYDTVNYLEQRTLKPFHAPFLKAKGDYPLKHILNLHDREGIKSPEQIAVMVSGIKKGYHMINVNNVPNIKLVPTIRKELVIFDGHHSLLAYMSLGMKYLDEVPHLIVRNEHSSCVNEEDILVFFGPHAKSLKNKNWRDYTINWQAPFEDQIRKRQLKNMMELMKDTIPYLNITPAAAF